VNRMIGTHDAELVELQNSTMYLLIQRHMQRITIASLANSMVQITICNFKQEI